MGSKSSTMMDEEICGMNHRGGGLDKNEDTTSITTKKETISEQTAELVKLVEDNERPISLCKLKLLLLGETNDHERAREIIKKAPIFFHMVFVNHHITIDLVQWLIKVCPEAARIKDEAYGRTPLHYACWNRSINIEIVELLINIYPEAQRILALPKKNNNENYSFCAATPLVCAIYSSRIDIVKLLVRKDPKSVFINAGGSSNYGLTGFGTVVHLVCKKEHVSLDVLKTLVEIFPQSLSLKLTVKQELPLHKLLSYNSRHDSITEMVRFLVQMCPASVNKATDNGWLPIHLACFFKAPLETIKLLGNYREPTPRHSRLRSQLELYFDDCRSQCTDKEASLKLCIHTIRFLVEKHPESLELSNGMNQKPLEQVLFKQPLEVIRCLLELYPENFIPTASLLRRIALESDSDVLQHFVSAFPDSFARTSSGLECPTTLHAACGSSKRTISDLQQIVHLHPEAIKIQDDYAGNTPLHKACLVSKEGIGVAIPFLIANYRTASTVRNYKGQLPLHLLCQTADCTSANTSAAVTIRSIKQLLAAYPTAAAEKDSNGYLPLHVACMNGHGVEVIKPLLEVYPLSIQVASDRGLPIRCVFENKSNYNDRHIEVIKLLVAYYPSNIEMTTTHDGMLPINFALSSGRNDIFDVFLDRLYGHNSDSNLILHSVLKDQNLRDNMKGKIVQRILDDHPEHIPVLDDEGASPLHWAVRSNVGIDLIQQLIALNIEALRQSDKSGCLPLHYCVAYGNPTEENAAVTKMLVEQYPQSLRVSDVTGNLPLHRALMRKYPLDTVEDVLLDKYPESAKIADRDGRLPVHIACENGSPIDLIKHLVLLYPESLAIIDHSGECPLHKACQAGHLSLAEWLSDKDGRALRKVNKEGMTPFVILCHSTSMQRDFYDELEEVSAIWNILVKNPEAMLVPHREDSRKAMKEKRDTA